MKFTVEIPDRTFMRANAEGVNRQMVAKFLREELEQVCFRYGFGRDRKANPHEWRAFIFRQVKVTHPWKFDPRGEDD